jgi:hypothetical protein
MARYLAKKETHLLSKDIVDMSEGSIFLVLPFSPNSANAGLKDLPVHSYDSSQKMVCVPIN